MEALTLSQFLQQARQQSHALVTLGNGYDYPFQPFSSHYFLGASQVLDRLGPQWQQQLNQFVQGATVAGYLGYDLKNRIEKLRNQHQPLLPFPELCLFKPQRHGPITQMQWQPDSPGINGCSPVETWPDYDHYLKGFEQIRQHLRDGDIYELNYCIAHQFSFESADPYALFGRLNGLSANPFSGFMKLGHQYILSASPERFLKRVGAQLISQPIKGTAPRHADATADATAKQALATSEKEQAENRMIVDLVRNDLTRVGVPGTTEVPELFGIYSFPQVHQMISTVTSTLAPQASMAQIISGTFPMGSMTGAPKIRAMEIIDQVEHFARGPFSGAMGYVRGHGDFDFNVLIRSLFLDLNLKRGFFCTGGAITWQSQPKAEYEECLLKAAAIMRLLK